jgi:hypothetical protein
MINHEGSPITPYSVREVEQGQPTYRSLFDEIDFNAKSGSEIRFMVYNGTLQSVIDELSEELEDDANLDPVIRVMHAPRIVRSVIDGTRGGRSEDGLPLVQHAMEIVKGVYKRDASPTDLENLKTEMVEKSMEDIFTNPLTQQLDGISWEAMDPEKSAYSAELLSDKFQGKDLLFIPLAHGGIGAGLDILLRYEEKTRSLNSVIYPIRFSSYKHNDKYPQVLYTEMDFLEEAAHEREVVVFDEDISTGRTLASAKRFFEQYVFGGQEVTKLTNLNSAHHPQLNPGVR